MATGARLVWLVRVSIALDALLYAGLIPLLPQLGIDAGLTDGALGLLLGIYPLAGVISCIPFGVLSDRWKPGLLMFGGMAGSALGALAIAIWPTPLVIGLSRFVQGVASSAVWTAGFTLIDHHAPAGRRIREFGATYSASSAGELAGPLMSGFLAERASMSAFFGIAGLLSAGVAGVLALLRFERPRRPKRAAAGAVARQGGYAALAGGAALAGLYMVIYGALMLLAPLLLARQHGLTAFAIGEVFLGWHLVLIFSQTGGGHWGDHAGWLAPILAGTLALAAGLLVMGTWTSLVGVCLGMGLAGLGLGIASTVATPLFSDAWAEVQPAGSGMGVAFGAMNTIWSVGFMIGNTGSGFVLTVFPLQAVLVAAAVVVLASGLLMALFGRRMESSPAGIAGD